MGDGQRIVYYQKQRVNNKMFGLNLNFIVTLFIVTACLLNQTEGAATFGVKNGLLSDIYYWFSEYPLESTLVYCSVRLDINCQVKTNFFSELF